MNSKVTNPELPVATSHDLAHIIIGCIDRLDIRESTRRDYLYRVQELVDFLQVNGLGENVLIEYKRYLDEKYQTVATKKKYFNVARVVLKEFFRLAGRKDFTIGIKGFRDDRLHKKVGPSDEEVKALLNSVKDPREKAMLFLFIYQGLREIEIVRLNVQDLDLENGIMMIHGKGRDDTEPVYIMDPVIPVLEFYIWKFKPNRELFYSLSNNAKGKRLTTRAIQWMFKRIFNDHGIKTTPHGFRHWYTTYLIKHLENLEKVRTFTRHKSVNTLAVYNDEVDQAKFKDEVNEILGEF